mmetsp:Transcript_88417/g.161966  ORF Transcript_88417/g.161966 Transcript_88417/m.161966 type:complete len:207 (-) Transcript_88417:49-669(-)
MLPCLSLVGGPVAPAVLLAVADDETDGAWRLVRKRTSARVMLSAHSLVRARKLNPAELGPKPSAGARYEGGPCLGPSFCMCRLSCSVKSSDASMCRIGLPEGVPGAASCSAPPPSGACAGAAVRSMSVLSETQLASPISSSDSLGLSPGAATGSRAFATVPQYGQVKRPPLLASAPGRKRRQHVKCMRWEQARTSISPSGACGEKH